MYIYPEYKHTCGDSHSSGQVVKMPITNNSEKCIGLYILTAEKDAKQDKRKGY